MKKIAVIFADGMEEIEGITPVDILRRCDSVCVDVISACEEQIVGSHGIIINTEKLAKDVDFACYDGIIIPGGMPGATNISKNSFVVNGLKFMEENQKLICAICASPAVVLAKNGIKKGNKITCYPANVFLDLLTGYEYTGESVCVSENLITANGPKSAMEFSLAICKFLGLNPKF